MYHIFFKQESQLAKVIEKNTELTLQNSDLQKQIQNLQHVSICTLLSCCTHALILYIILSTCLSTFDYSA